MLKAVVTWDFNNLSRLCSRYSEPGDLHGQKTTDISKLFPFNYLMVKYLVYLVEDIEFCLKLSFDF